MHYQQEQYCSQGDRIWLGGLYITVVYDSPKLNLTNHHKQYTIYLCHPNFIRAGGQFGNKCLKSFFRGKYNEKSLRNDNLGKKIRQKMESFQFKMLDNVFPLSRDIYKFLQMTHLRELDLQMASASKWRFAFVFWLPSGSQAERERDPPDTNSCLLFFFSRQLKC